MCKMSTIIPLLVSLQITGQIPIGPKGPTVKSDLGRSERLTKQKNGTALVIYTNKNITASQGLLAKIKCQQKY